MMPCLGGGLIPAPSKTSGMFRRDRFGAAVAVVLVAVPLMAFSAPSLQIAGPQVRVGQAGHRLGEFSVARDPNDPRHLVTATFDLDHEAGGIGCVVYESFDAGAAWSSTGSIPGMQDGHAHLDPWTAIDGDGRTHLACIDNEFAALSAAPYVPSEYARRVDGTWSENTTLPNLAGATFRNTDKLSLLADRRGHVYVCVIESTPQGPFLVVHRSRDGGETWESPTKVGTDLQANCNGFVEAPNGDITLLWINLAGPLGFATVGTVSSFDGGDTWQHRSVVGQYIIRPGVEQDTPQGRYGVFYPVGPQHNFPALAVSPVNGHLFMSYATWVEDRYTTKLFRSTDRGATYSPVALPAPWSPTCTDCSDLQAALTVDDAGNLGMQIVLADELSLQREVWFMASLDEGDTWLAPLQIASSGADASWLGPGHYAGEPNLLNGLPATTPDDAASDGFGVAAPSIFKTQRRDGGDYWNIISVPEGFLCMWIDHTDGGIQQIWSRLVTIS